MGDVILATPLVESLSRQFPDAEIHVLVKKGNEQLLVNHPLITQTWVYDKANGKLANLRKLRSSLSKVRFNWVINCHRFFTSGLLSVLIKGKVSGFNKNPLSLLYQRKVNHEYRDGLHEVDRNLMLIDHLVSKENQVRQPRLYPSDVAFREIEKYTSDRFWVIAPASVWFTKQYPVEKWRNLLKKADGKPVYLIGGPNDFELCERLGQGYLNTINLAGKLSILESTALMSSAEMCYTNDSGPTHMASAVDANCTVAFCSTTPTFGFGPIGKNVRIVQTQEKLKCRPCGIHGKNACPEGHFNCSKFEIELD